MKFYAADECWAQGLLVQKEATTTWYVCPCRSRQVGMLPECTEMLTTFKATLLRPYASASMWVMSYEIL